MSGPGIVEIPLERIRAPRGQRPEDYTEAEVEAFARALRATGRVENPALVRPAGPESEDYELITGGLRFAASHRVGAPTLPCRVRDVSDAEARLIALVEDAAGKAEKMLPLGWALLKAMEATGLTQAEFAAMTSRKPSKISEAVSAARAVPEPMLGEVAQAQGVAAEVARALPRKDLRRIAKVRDPAERRAQLGHGLRRMRERAPVDAREDARPRPIIVADGGVRLDQAVIGTLNSVQLMATAARTLWFLARAWVACSPKFAGLRAANRPDLIP